MKKDLLSSSTLKIIAMLCMAIDHTAAGIINNVNNISLLGLNVNELYYAMRSIGRIAFPIFLFLLIEGFNKTKNIKKYFFRMVTFAIISEIPFDMALNGGYYNTHSQNVYVELSLILAMLYCVKISVENFSGLKGKFLCVIIVVIFAGVSEIIEADYGMYGIVAAIIMYSFSKNRETRAMSILPAFAFEIHMPTVFLSIPLVYLYNGKRGLNLKYLFYAFYPLHLIIIGIIRMKLL